MHRNRSADTEQRVRRCGTLERHEHADAADTGRDGAMGVRRNDAGAGVDRYERGPSQLDVLAGSGCQTDNQIGYASVTVRRGRVEHGITISADLEGHSRERCRRFLKRLGPRDEIRFGIQLDDRPARPIHREGHKPFRGDTIGLLRRFRGLLGTQTIDGGVEIALRLNQRIPAGDHPGAGLVAERLHRGWRQFQPCAVSECYESSRALVNFSSDAVAAMSPIRMTFNRSRSRS